jgi:hypothetical protein
MNGSVWYGARMVCVLNRNLRFNRNPSLSNFSKVLSLELGSSRHTGLPNPTRCVLFLEYINIYLYVSVCV